MIKSVQHESNRKLLDAAQNVFRTKGYAATTVDDICEAAIVTQGSFFHHFKSKEALTLDAAALRADYLNGLRHASLMIFDAVALAPWGSRFVQHVRMHKAAFSGMPDYMHRALLAA